MDFEYSPDENMLAETAARYCAAAGPQADHWAEMAALGWFGAGLDEDEGGFGLGLAGAAILAEACGAAALADPLLGHAGLAVPALRGAGPAALRARAVAGEARLGAALAERGTRHDLSRARAEARAAGDGFRLTGSKEPAPGVMTADHLVVSASLDGATAVFLVDATADGVSRTALNGADGRDIGRVDLTDARAVHRLAVAPEGLEVALHCLLAADSCGAMRRLMDLTRQQLEERRQFGRRIGAFQVLQHRFADMHVAMNEARALMLAACMAADAGAAEAARLARMAWIQAAWSSRRIAEEAVQMHGATGITAECAVGGLVRRLSVNEALAGHADLHLALLADGVSGG